MLNFESLLSGNPVRAVDADDMKRVWEFTSEGGPPKGATLGHVAFDIRLVASQCSEGADPLAVFFRAALLNPLLDGGLLKDWCDGGRPYDVVFQTLAMFPLPEGIQSFRPEEFIEALKRAG